MKSNSIERYVSIIFFSRPFEFIMGKNLLASNLTSTAFVSWSIGPTKDWSQRML